MFREIASHVRSRIQQGPFLLMVSLAVCGCSTAQAIETVPTREPTESAAAEPAAIQSPSPPPNQSTEREPTAASSDLSDAPTAEVERYTYKVIERYPHDPSAFTQGLVYVDDYFYEGTGLYGQSTLRKVEPESGDLLVGARLPNEVFGEGITLFDGKIYQLTWKARTGYIIDAETFELLDTFTYGSEGWGLTHDGERLIMSDGSHRLTYLDPETLEQTGQIEVFDGDAAVTQLNELEFIDGQIYANIWQTDQIAIIDPESGQVTAWIDLTGLLPTEELAQPVDVLNGIAYDAEGDRLFVTGKLWPTIFEVELIEVGE